MSVSSVVDIKKGPCVVMMQGPFLRCVGRTLGSLEEIVILESVFARKNGF